MLSVQKQPQETCFAYPTVQACAIHVVKVFLMRTTEHIECLVDLYNAVLHAPLIGEIAEVTLKQSVMLKLF